MVTPKGFALVPQALSAEFPRSDAVIQLAALAHYNLQARGATIAGQAALMSQPHSALACPACKPVLLADWLRRCNIPSCSAMPCPSAEL